MKTSKRLYVVDALRGFALAGIVLGHMIEQFTGWMTPPEFRQAVLQGSADEAVEGLATLFIRGKFFAIFSLLFGLSFFIQMDNARQRGQSYGGRFVWRLVILFGIGVLNHAFYRGDILMIYAVLGLMLVPVFQLSSRWLWLFILVCFAGSFRYLVFMLNGAENLLPGPSMEPGSAGVDGYYDVIKHGSLADVMAYNLTEGILGKTNFQLGFFGRAYLTTGFFLLGLWLGRKGFFHQLAGSRSLTKKLCVAGGVFTIPFLVAAGMILGQGEGGQIPVFDSWPKMLGLSSYDLSNLSLTVFIVCSFVLLFGTGRGGKILAVLVPFGQMALTNYVLQNLVGTYLLYGWGLGLLGEIGAAQALQLGLGVIAVQIALSHLWLHFFRYGPLEWLWRCLTDLKWQSIRRSEDSRLRLTEVSG